MPIFGKKKPEDMKEEELFRRGKLAFSEQNWEETSEYTRILVKKNPKYIPAREMLTMSLIQQHKADEALEHCRYLIKTDSQNALYYVHLGSCYQLQGKNDDAIQELGRSLEIHENPLIRGMMLYLKTPNIPLVNLDALDNSMASILARALADTDNIEKLDKLDDPQLSKTARIMTEQGKKMKDELLDGKDPEVFMKEIADACIENNCYALIKDLLKKTKDIDELRIQLQILESKSGIKGRFAQFQHLEFVHFEKV